MLRQIIKLKTIPNKDILKDLLELFVYYNLSYSTGLREECTVKISDELGLIETPTMIYKLTDDIYTQLYLLANKVTANLYKEADDFKLL